MIMYFTGSLGKKKYEFHTENTSLFPEFFSQVFLHPIENEYGKEKNFEEIRFLFSSPILKTIS